MRLFIAIELPENVKEYLAEIQEEIRNNVADKIRCINKNQIHLTLKFLGEIQPNIVEKIKSNLEKIKFGSFSVVLDNLGVFPSESYNSCFSSCIITLPKVPVLTYDRRYTYNSSSFSN